MVCLIYYIGDIILYRKAVSAKINHSLVKRLFINILFQISYLSIIYILTNYYLLVLVIFFFTRLNGFSNQFYLLQNVQEVVNHQ